VWGNGFTFGKVSRNVGRDIFMFFVLCYCVRRLHVTRCGVREEHQLVLLREESCILP
jgi:hypothetical protein